MPTAFPFRILQEHPQKSKWGEPCNNCGLCCHVQACHVSKTLLHSEQAPCIALEVHDGKYLCGMLLRPEHYLGADYDGRHSAFIDYWLNPGVGCQMRDEIGAIRSTDLGEARQSGDAIWEV